MYSAAAGYAAGLSVEPSKLLASGASGAALIRWGSLVDMFGYVSIAPVVIYLRGCARDVADVGDDPGGGLAAGHRLGREAKGTAVCFCDPRNSGGYQRGYRAVPSRGGGLGWGRDYERYRTAQQTPVELKRPAERLDPVLHPH